MTDCASGVCGTGGWAGPLPGDPDTSVGAIALTATPAFGGIDVNWTYPAVNPEAVAHTLLYRGDVADFSAAIQRAVVAGNSYYDKIDSASTFYYWIRIVSVNGTLGDLIGPASAMPQTIIGTMLEKLTGQIDAGVLAQSLKGDLGRITLLESDLQSEITSREDGTTTLAQAIQQAQDGVAQALTFIGTEGQTRSDQNSLLADQLTAVAVTSGNNLAAVQQDLQSKINTVDGRVTIVANQVTQVAAQAAGDLSTAQTALNASISTVDGRVTVLSSHVDAVQSQAAGNLAAVQTILQTNISVVDGKAQAIGAQWNARLTVNGLVGGFGIYNDGSTIEAGFDVDTFWVGRTGADLRKPFIISNGVVYIDQALINSLTFSKLQDDLGTFLVENGRIKGEYLRVKTASIDDLAVDTLQIAGNAVTIPASATGSSDTGVSVTINCVAGQPIFMLGQSGSTAGSTTGSTNGSLFVDGVAVKSGFEIGAPYSYDSQGIPVNYVVGGLVITTLYTPNTAGNHTFSYSTDGPATSATIFVLQTKR